MRHANPLRLRAVGMQVRAKQGLQRQVLLQAHLLLVPAIATYGEVHRLLCPLTHHEASGRLAEPDIPSSASSPPCSPSLGGRLRGAVVVSISQRSNPEEGGGGGGPAVPGQPNSGPN